MTQIIRLLKWSLSYLGLALSQFEMVYVFQGIMDLHPRAINSIPSKAHLEIGTSDI